MFNDFSLPVIVSTAAKESELGAVYNVSSKGCLDLDTYIRVNKVKSSGVLSIKRPGAQPIRSGEAWSDKSYQKNPVGKLS